MESSCTEVAPLLTLTPLSCFRTLLPSCGQSHPASTRQSCRIARDPVGSGWRRSLGGLWSQPCSPHGHIQFQKSPWVEISRPLGARDATQLLCRGEIIFLGIPFPDKFNLLVPPFLFCCIPTSKPLVNVQRPKPISTLNFSTKGTYTPAFP